MSFNKTINAVIALVEERPSLARDILRDPTSGVKNVTEVMSRLQSAIQKNAANEIRQGLMSCLSIQRPDDLNDPDLEDAFFRGVRAVEELFEAVAEELVG